MNKFSLDTPALMINWPVMLNNINAMADFCHHAGVNLRPHTKTHKSPLIAAQQLKAGASGITVAKLEEAEVMVQAGLTDILVAYPILGPVKIERLLQLRHFADIIVTVDSLEGVRALSEAGVRSKKPVSIYIEIDTGLGRVGLKAGKQAVEFIKQVNLLPGVDYRGLMTHAGHAHGAQGDKLKRIGYDEGNLLVEIAEELRKAGVATDVISVGSTPTARISGSVPGVTELRPGTYVFNDASLVDTGHCDPDDCALTVLVTVISHPAPNRFVIDAGSKSLSSDQPGSVQGYGMIRSMGQILRSRITWLNEEHGVIETLQDESGHLHIGHKIEVIPNHACPVVNLFNQAEIVGQEEVLMTLPVAARGKLR